jgi:hypothetical protein
MAAKQGLKDERLVREIQERGSKALPTPNPNGVRLSKKAKPSTERPALPIGAAQIRPVEKVQPTLDTTNFDIDNVKNDPLYGYISEKEIDGGIISGKLIRPKYNNAELKKSIDTEIFELLPNIPAPQPDTVPRPVYNVATQSIVDLTAEVQRLNFEVNDLTAKVSELEIVSESLKIEADNQLLRANIAEDTATVANTQVAVTTIDLQNAIQNSINEAVQRVSLTARIEALQESFRVQKELTEQREKENAAQTAVEGLNGFFQQTANVGWKISANDVQKPGELGMYMECQNGDEVKWWNGSKGIAFFNFTDTEQTFTLSYSANKKDGVTWFSGPASFKVPARTENAAGVTTSKFRYNALKGHGGDRNTTFKATVIINTTAGDKLEFTAKYKKERSSRDDKFGTVGSAVVTVGQDLTGG